MPTLILTVLAAALLLAPARAQDGAKLPAQEQVDVSTQKIKELRKERIATLKLAADQLEDQFKNARVDYADVLEVQLLCVQAERDAAEPGEKRIALTAAAVELLQNHERTAQLRVDVARGTIALVFSAKARRLEAEIRLEQTKIAEAGSQTKEQIAESAAKIKELRKERIDTLNQLIETLTSLAANGRIGYGDVADAQLMLLRADLNAAESSAERIALYKSAVDLLLKVEELAETRLKDARGSATDVAKVKMRHRDAELQLARAKVKEAGPLTRQPIVVTAWKIKVLQKERIATLKGQVSTLTHLAEYARAEFGEAVDAQLLLLQAELDAAENEADILALYKGAIGPLKKFEDLADARLKSPRGRGADPAKIKVRRLEIEIQLEQMKIQEAKRRQVIDYRKDDAVRVSR